MSKARKTIKKAQQIKESPFKNYWKKSNYVLFAISFFVLLLGFFLMNQGPWDNPISLSYSPIVLLLAYLVLFPLSIMYKKKRSSK